MTKPLVPLIGYLALMAVALAAVLLVALGQPPTTGPGAPRATFAAPTPSAQTGSSGGTTGSATNPTPSAGGFPGSTSTPGPSSTVAVLPTPPATATPYRKPTPSLEMRVLLTIEARTRPTARPTSSPDLTVYGGSFVGNDQP